MNNAYNLTMLPLKFNKILWAIDPFSETVRFQTPIKALKYLAEVTNAQIQPVYVISSPGLSRLEGVEWNSYSTDLPNAQKSTDVMFKDIYLRNLLPPKVVQTQLAHPGKVIDRLLEYAARMKADLIVADTHARVGLIRLFQGSFVERLLLKSPFPVLVLSPTVKEIHAFDRILYATHVDQLSNQVFRDATCIAKTYHSELTVLHILSRSERDRAGDNSTAVGEDLPFHSDLMRRSRAWAKWARHQGIKTEMVFEDSLFSFSEQILRAASHRRSSLIILEARSGIFGSFFKGSIVRQIIRNAKCPVWIQRFSSSQVTHSRTSLHLDKAA